MPKTPNSKEQMIIDHVMGRKKSYYNSNAFQFFQRQGESVISAANQTYRPREQTTRSGFYLATHAALYESQIETFSQIFSQADPLWIFSSKKSGGEEIAQKSQFAMNRMWDNMGANNLGGVQQWLALTRDVPIYAMAVSYQRWIRRTGYVQKPSLKMDQQAWSEIIDWSSEFDVMQSEPEIERVHPYNWFGDWRSGRPPWEGILRRWTLADILPLKDDKSYRNIDKLIERIQKNGQELDTDFFQVQDRNNGDTRENNREADMIEYWGLINQVEGFEDDATEYQIICDDQWIYKIAANPMPGFRPINRTVSSPQNDSPYGRSLLAPNLPHTRIMNLLTNLGIDDVVTRMHNGWAIWEQYLENPDEFLNPIGTNSPVRMTPNATEKHLPRRIGGESSGIMRDMLNIDQIVNTDKQRAGDTDQSLGLRDEKNETATGRLILKNADNKRTRAAIINMVRTGLIPIGKQLNLLFMKNTPEMERQNLSYDGQAFSITNNDIVQMWNNNYFDIHESVVHDQETEQLKLTRFLELSRDILLQDPRGLQPLLNTVRDIGNRMGIPNVEHYFPKDVPPQVNQALPAGAGQQDLSPLPEGQQAAVPQVENPLAGQAI